MVLDLINYDNAVFRSYAYWMAVLIFKTLIMAPLTGRQRFKNKVLFQKFQRTFLCASSFFKTFANAEDAKIAGGTVKFDQDNVERVRRYT